MMSGPRLAATEVDPRHCGSRLVGGSPPIGWIALDAEGHVLIFQIPRSEVSMWTIFSLCIVSPVFYSACDHCDRRPRRHHFCRKEDCGIR